MKKINPNDPRLPELYTKANLRGLKATEIAGGIYQVTSSNPHRAPYEADANRMSCNCTAGGFNQPCTHLALALAESSLSKWREYRDAECIRFNKDRLERQSKLWWKVYERQRAHAELMVELMAA